jgi:Domain of Unknown Function (DUF928)
MKNRFWATLSCTLLLVSHAIAIGPLAANAGSPLSFKPPSRNQPKVTIGSGARSDCIPDRQNPGEIPNKLKALLPEGQFSLTSADQLNVMVYIPRHKSGKTLTLSLSPVGSSPVGPAARPLLSQSFSVPANAGLVRLSLNDAKLAKLAIGKQYLWTVQLMCERIVRDIPTEPYIENSIGGRDQGIIERILPDAQLKKTIEAADAQQLPRVYAEAGIWQDALLSLHERRRTQPHNAELNADWESLLKSAGLSDFAQAPIAECCTIQPEKPALPEKPVLPRTPAHP